MSRKMPIALVQSFEEADRFATLAKATSAVASWSRGRAVEELRFIIQTDANGAWFVKVDHGAATFGWLSIRERQA